jgi:hypothetical protein
MKNKTVKVYCPSCKKSYFHNGFKKHLEAKHPAIFFETENLINKEHTKKQTEKIYADHFQQCIDRGLLDSSIGKYGFRDKKHKDQYTNKIRKYCAKLESAGNQATLNQLQTEYHSRKKELVAEIICDYFRISRKELRTGILEEKPQIPRTLGWEKLQRSGFEDGAHVPGSHLRKVDK